MRTLTDLNGLRIASPCPASWDAMRGDGRVRFCDSCSKHVYDLSNLTVTEGLALVQRSEGRLCIRHYRRRDGTVLTADCPVGLRYAVRRRLLRLATAGVVAFATLRSGVRLYADGGGLVDISPAPTGPGVWVSDWADWAVTVLGLKTPRRGTGVLMGKICPVRPPVSPEPRSGIFRSSVPQVDPPDVAPGPGDPEPS